MIGFTSSDKEKLSALLLGAYMGSNLVYIGRVGTGFDEKERNELYGILAKIKTSEPITEISGIERNDVVVTYTKPELIAEVKFQEITQDHMLRAPSFIRLRSDKKPEECTLESVTPVSIS